MPRAPGGRELEVGALGDEVALTGLRLVGVHVRVATTPDQVREGWAALQGAGLVLLTPTVAEVLGPDRLAPESPLTVVMPP